MLQFVSETINPGRNSISKIKLLAVRLESFLSMFAKLFISSLVCTSYVAAMAITQRSEISVALLPRDYPYTGTLTGDG